MSICFRHPYPLFALHYRYRFQAPDLTSYGTSSTSFNAEILENFNWNYLDHYICTRGDTDFSLIEVRFEFKFTFKFCEILDFRISCKKKKKVNFIKLD